MIAGKVLFGQTNPVNSPSCGFDGINNQLRLSDPTFEEEFRHFREEVIPALSSQNRGAVEPLITISVVVHVIHSGEPLGQGANISDEQVQDQIAILNADYTATNEKYYDTPAKWTDLAGMPNIQFLLATVDPDGNPTNGITRHNIPITGSSWNNNNINSSIKPAVNWDPLRYMNIYVAGIPGTTAAGGIVGYSNYPTQSLIGADRDGPVIDYHWFGGPGHPVSGWSPISHETGHFLGLSHTFDGSSCNTDDGIADTPNVDDATSAYVTLDCSGGYPTGPQSCGNEHLYVNFMDYVNENCYTSFTPGQINVMRSVLDGTSSGLGYGSRELLISNAPSQTFIPGNDAGVVRIISPETINCTPYVLTPAVTIRNFGSQDLTAVSIHYQVDNGPVTSYSWQGNLFPGETTDVVLPDFTPPDGLYDLKVYTTNPNAQTDDRETNDQFEKTFRTYFAFDPPMIETADDEVSFPTTVGTFQVNFGNDDFEWEITNETSAYGYGSESFVFNNRAGSVSNNPSDSYDILVTRHFDFSEVTNAALYFDVAHADFNNLQVDTLYVLVAVGCTQNFNGFVYKKWGAALNTAPNTQNIFTPTASQWRSEGVDLSFFDGLDDVTIGFLNVSNWGNRMFIDNIRVGVDCALLTDEWEVTDNGCDAACTGEATVSVPVSNGELTYSWEGWPASHNQPTVTGLCAGEIMVTITDEFGCQIVAAEEIEDASVPELNLNATAETAYFANNGTATATVNNATLPITFSWSNGTVVTVNNNSHSISGLPPGLYEVEITDANGCSNTSQVMVTSVCDGFDVSVSTTNVLCNGVSSGSATATPINGSGSFNFNWSNGISTSINNSLNAGTHTVTVTDANGCPTVESFTITEPDILSVNLSSTNETSINAMDGTATATPSGGTQGYSYLWNTGSTLATIVGLSPGTYFVTVTDENGCTASESVSIQSVDCNNFSASISAEDVSCFGMNNGTANVTAFGATSPVNYNWSNGETGSMIENLPAGNYSVTVIDASGCSATLNTQVQAPPALSLSFSTTNVSSANTSDGTATAIVSGGIPISGNTYNYVWSNGGTTSTIAGLMAGFYNVVVTDFNGCTITGNIEVTAIDCQLSIQLSSENASCPNVADGSATVSEVTGGTAPLSYLWSNGATSASIENLLPENYLVTVSDANGCTVAGWVPIQGIDQTPPTLILVDQLVIDIENAPFQFDPFSADNGSFDNCSLINLSASQTIFDCSDIGQTTITISAEDANGNTSSADLPITVNDKLPPIITCPDDISIENCEVIIYDLPVVEDNCGVDDIQLLEGFASGNHFPTGTTLVTWQAVDEAGNSANCSFQVTVDYDFALSNAIINHPTCHGDSNGSVEVLVNGGSAPFQTIWSHGGDPTNLPAGDYSTTITDANGCNIIGTFQVIDPPVLEIGVVEIVPAMGGQQTGMIVLSISGGVTPYQLTWFENGTELPGFDPLVTPPGTYNVEVTDEYGCKKAGGPYLVDNLNSTSSLELYHQIALFPNPTSETVSIKTAYQLNDLLEISIFDINGKACFLQKFPSVQAVGQLDISQIGKGVFWVKLLIGQEVVWKKLIVV